MNKWLKNLSIAVICLGVSTSSYAKPINDAIVAIVDNEIITLKDLKGYIAGVYRQLKIEQKSPQEIQEIISSYEERGINQLIEDKLILASANQKGIEIRPEIVEKRLKEIKSQYPSEDQFLSEIVAQGLTVTDIKNKIINQLKSKYQVDLEVRNKIFVNPEDVTQYYNTHKDQFESKVKYNLDSIFIPFNDQRDEAIKRIKEARAKLIGGAVFQAVAKEYSQAPSVGILEQGQMVPAIEKEVFSLKVGDISQVVPVDAGVYVFKVKEIIPGKKKTLEEVKNDIYNYLSRVQFQEKFKAWVEKLREKAYVEIRN